MECDDGTERFGCTGEELVAVMPGDTRCSFDKRVPVLPTRALDGSVA
jgi:hypothetical protein